jgi:hypothetical protein
MRNVPSLETVYRDYQSKDVQFYYVYKKLAHPEGNGFVDPVSIEERVKHVAIAKKELKTEFGWLCDNMENDLTRAMGGANNSEFIFDKNGEVVVSRAWSNAEQLREDLARLVGESESVTTVSDLGWKNNRIAGQKSEIRKGVLPRVKLEGSYSALKSELTANSDGENYYVKLRAEADSKLLNGETGSLYLGFHVDPIYEFHWNNLAGLGKVELKLPSGDVVTKELPDPEVDADVDPREIVIEIDEADAKGPIEVTGKFFVCDDGATVCLALSQTYQVEMTVDKEVGRRMGGGGRRGRGGGGAGSGDRAQRMMQRDQNGDGKISKDEMPERAREMFDRMDTNSDGFIDEEELKNMPGGRGGRGRGGRGGGRRGRGGPGGNSSS